MPNMTLRTPPLMPGSTAPRPTKAPCIICKKILKKFQLAFFLFLISVFALIVIPISFDANLFYGTKGLFHYNIDSKILAAAKFIRQSVDKYSADVYGQSICIKYRMSRHGWYTLGKRTALLYIIFVFFGQGGKRKARDYEKEEECELIPVQ